MQYMEVSVWGIILRYKVDGWKFCDKANEILVLCWDDWTGRTELWAKTKNSSNWRSNFSVVIMGIGGGRYSDLETC